MQQDDDIRRFFRCMAVIAARKGRLELIQFDAGAAREHGEIAHRAERLLAPGRNAQAGFMRHGATPNRCV